MAGARVYNHDLALRQGAGRVRRHMLGDPPMARHTVVHVDISQWQRIGGVADDRANMKAFLHLYGVYAHKSMDTSIGLTRQELGRDRSCLPSPYDCSHPIGPTVQASDRRLQLMVAAVIATAFGPVADATRDPITRGQPTTLAMWDSGDVLMLMTFGMICFSAGCMLGLLCSFTCPLIPQSRWQRGARDGPLSK